VTAREFGAPMGGGTPPHFHRSVRSMAIYEYEILDSDGGVVGVYEVEQKMSEPALTEHPDTGQKLRRILSATFAHGAKATSALGCESGNCGLGGGAGFDPGGGCCGGGACGLN